MKKLIIPILMLLLTVSAQAQIPQEVIDVLTKCSQKMDNPAGVQCDMKASAGISFVKVNVNLTLYSKGEKSFEKTSMKILGKEIKAESGFDGVQEWEYQPKIKKDDKDTLTITKRVKKSKGEYDIDFDLHKDYKTAKMQVKNGVIKKSVMNSRGDERGYPDMKDFSVNLGSGKKAGKHIVIKLKGNGAAEKSGISYDDLIIYRIPLSTYRKNAEVLVDNSMKVTQFNNDYIRGTITADGQKLLYLSILDNYGWDAYVDGRKVKTRDRMDIAFMGIDLEQGEHTIELRYHTRGFISGAVLSFAGLLCAIFICFLHRKMYN